ncbi:hypothetical protein Baya_0800 [Bagarius yarrelli]|uniref:Uncharacterized protein n=1 Tax=Bagarius yarrelli TaxID=175774 RepID=A0A556TJ99_BAGYA|nr:hypothetical protein Baya_0800 [Bagarius yarrelli]
MKPWRGPLEVSVHFGPAGVSFSPGAGKVLWPYGRAGVFELAGGADRTGLWRGSSRPACVRSTLPEQSVGWRSSGGDREQCMRLNARGTGFTRKKETKPGNGLCKTGNIALFGNVVYSGLLNDHFWHFGVPLVTRLVLGFAWGNGLTGPHFAADENEVAHKSRGGRLQPLRHNSQCPNRIGRAECAEAVMCYGS